MGRMKRSRTGPAVVELFNWFKDHYAELTKSQKARFMKELQQPYRIPPLGGRWAQTKPGYQPERGLVPYSKGGVRRRRNRGTTVRTLDPSEEKKEWHDWHANKRPRWQRPEYRPPGFFKRKIKSKRSHGKWYINSRRMKQKSWWTVKGSSVKNKSFYN